MAQTIVELSKDKLHCRINKEQVITVGQTTDYKSASEERTSVGKILEFKFAGYKQEDKESVWMLIEDAVDATIKEWISVRLWKRQFDDGIFNELRIRNKNVKARSNASSKPEDTTKYPF